MFFCFPAGSGGEALSKHTEGFDPLYADSV
jgi:hypothetical protein